MTQITTPELLRAESKHTGFTVPVLIGIVAKSALIRHLATTVPGKEFVLKGGTLLHHVYASPRYSIKDADFTYRNPALITEHALNTALTVDETDFSVDFSETKWDKEQAIWSADVGYTLGRATSVGRDRLMVTVSIRLGEWLDPQEPVLYRDPMLNGVSEFAVNGLTLEELAAEKILAWSTKTLAKHAMDLACLARDHPEIDRDKVRRLAAQKFEIEGHMPRYVNHGIRAFRDLATAVASDQAFGQLTAQWKVDDLLVPTAERAHHQTLREQQTVEDLIREFWVPALS